jgi:hypothetical protein
VWDEIDHAPHIFKGHHLSARLPDALATVVNNLPVDRGCPCYDGSCSVVSRGEVSSPLILTASARLQGNGVLATPSLCPWCRHVALLCRLVRVDKALVAPHHT